MALVRLDVKECRFHMKGISVVTIYSREEKLINLVILQAAMEALPPLRPLCLVLKIFLQQRELNEVLPYAFCIAIF